MTSCKNKSNGIFLGVGLAIGALVGSGLCHSLLLLLSRKKTVVRSGSEENEPGEPNSTSDGDNNNPKKQNIIIVPYQELYNFCCQCLVNAGCSKENASTVVKVLLAADLRGITSHGIQRLHLYCFEIAAGAVDGNAKPRLLMHHQPAGSACAVVDGNNAQGAVVACFAVEAAVKIAKQHGCAVVVCKNSNHYGIAGYYTELVAREYGMLCLSMTNTSAIVVPTHSKESCLGTNPISLAAPTTSTTSSANNNNNDESQQQLPVLIDMATTTVPIGRVEVYQRQDNKPLPSKSWAVDWHGRPCTDPTEIIQNGGAMLPLGGASELNGGHKGYCSALLVELLCGVLAGGKFFGKNVDMTMNPRALDVKDTGAQISHFFLVIDPNFVEKSSSSRMDSSNNEPSFPERVSMLSQQLRSLQRVDPQVAVRVPGDKSHAQATKRMQQGIPILPSIAASLRESSQKYNVELPVSIR